MRKLFSIFSCLCFVFPLFLFIKAIDVEALAKKQASDDFRTNIVATQISNPEEMGWTGNEKKCNPGKLSHSTYVKMLARINYFRRLAGVGDKIVLDSNWNKYAQAAALIMFANQKLNHNPDASMRCYSSDGKIGANTSNLSLFSGISIQALISDQIEDGGSIDNKDCGHRRWLLFSKAYKFGFGATPESYAVRDFSTDQEKDTSYFHGVVPEYFAILSRVLFRIRLFFANGVLPFQAVPISKLPAFK